MNWNVATIAKQMNYGPRCPLAMAVIKGLGYSEVHV
jgi:hypothetical protein